MRINPLWIKMVAVTRVMKKKVLMYKALKVIVMYVRKKGGISANKMPIIVLYVV